MKEDFAPAFEKAHGPGYQALVMVDNSQGHSAYSEDALVVSRMNMNTGGKQPNMRNGWFIKDGVQVPQEMNFPPSHATHPGQLKGMKQILLERGLYWTGLVMQCKKKKDGSGGKCKSDATSCCAKRILELQPDFKEQKSLVQEVIEECGHICIFLPKFHCELNFIEFFWGAVKKYLRKHCDYTFKTLQENMPMALASVSLQTIRKWEHRMDRWVAAYDVGLGVKEAQKKVREFSSKNTSH